MPNKKNIQLLQEAKEKLGKSSAVFFVDYQKLTHQQLEEARKLFKENNSELSVIKNNLVEIAFKEDKNVDLTQQLHGPSATLFSYGDPVKTVKALFTFFKKYNMPQVKFGFFNNGLIDEKTVELLSTIPSKEILLGKLVGLLNAPLTKLVYDLNYTLTKFVFALKEVEKKKQA